MCHSVSIAMPTTTQTIDADHCSLTRHYSSKKKAKKKQKKKIGSSIHTTKTQVLARIVVSIFLPSSLGTLYLYCFTDSFLQSLPFPLYSSISMAVWIMEHTHTHTHKHTHTHTHKHTQIHTASHSLLHWLASWRKKPKITEEKTRASVSTISTKQNNRKERKKKEK